MSPPLMAEVPEELNITDLLMQHVDSGKNPALFALKDSDGQWTDISAEDFHRRVRALAKGLIASGLSAGDRVAIMSRTRYEWTLLDFAVWFAGCVSVPIYETSSPSQIEWILSDSGAKAIFVETRRHRAALDQVRGNLGELEHDWLIEDQGLERLEESGTDVPDELLENHRTAALGSELATLIYTSGTTGRPKGCELTHGNFTGLCKNSQLSFPEIVKYGSQTLMFLPLAHVLARFISVLCVDAGIKVGHTGDIKNLLADLGSFKPKFILAVPRVFEKVYNGSKLKAEDGGKGKIFAAAEHTAVEYSKAMEDPAGIPLKLKLKHALFSKLVYGKLLNAMGGQIEYAVSGGAPLGTRLGHFFRGIGLPILEGYGLTETAAPMTFNTPSKLRVGTVGQPLPGITVRIEDDGEIVSRGYNVFRGYWKNEEATAEAMRGGWFHTGDLGSLDDEGYLRITGRKKEILVTAGGKNVVPALLEDQIRSSPVVSQCVVVGDQRPFIAALITLDPEAMPGWRERHQLSPDMPMEEIIAHPTMVAEVQATVDRANETVSKAESIRAFRIVPTDFTEESGHLTPSMKIKRAKVMNDFAEEVEAIYAGKKPE